MLKSKTLYFAERFNRNCIQFAKLVKIMLLKYHNQINHLLVTYLSVKLTLRLCLKASLSHTSVLAITFQTYYF